jgi:hypothetical protein
MAKAKAKAPKRGGAKQEYKPPVIATDKLMTLLKRQARQAENVQEISGAMGEDVKKHAENHHLHKAAFAWIKKLHKMTPEKVREHLYHFDHMADAAGIRKKAASAPMLPLEDDKPVAGKKNGNGNAQSKSSEPVEEPTAETAPPSETEDSKVVNLH